jgi:dienelactone hydrolase
MTAIRMAGLASLLVLLASPLAAKDLPEQVVMIPKSSGVELETTIYRPEGAGPFPLVVINHGKAPVAPSTQPRARYTNASREFLSRGFIVAIPMRQGFSKSGGAYRGEGCEVEVNGRAQADDVEATLDYMVKLSYVDRTKIIIMGQSHGGLTTMAFGIRSYPGVRGLVDFAGGLKSTSCNWRQNNIEAFRSYGKEAKYPSLMFYGDNDSYWPSPLYRDFFEAYVQGGAKAELIAYGTFGTDSHTMFDSSRGMNIWVPKVMSFLKDLGFDTTTKVEYRVAASRQPLPLPTDFADIANVDAVPNVKQNGKDAYLKFLDGASPRAFAISTVGTNYSWITGREFAADSALENCNKSAKANVCKLYVVNDEVVW